MTLFAEKKRACDYWHEKAWLIDISKTRVLIDELETIAREVKRDLSWIDTILVAKPSLNASSPLGSTKLDDLEANPLFE